MSEKKIFENFNNDKNAKMDGKYRYTWVEESFNFDEKTGNQTPVEGTRTYLGTALSAGKMKFIRYVVAVILLVIGARLIFLQFLMGGYYRNLAEGNRIRLQPIYAERGIIYDRSGRELVENVPSFALAIVPQDLPKNMFDRGLLVRRLAASSGVDENYIWQILQKYGNYSYESLIIKENLDYNTALNLYIQNSDLPGVLIEKGTKRHYLLGEGTASSTLSLSHVLGYLGKIADDELPNLSQAGYLVTDNIGKIGLEKTYEQYLRGVYGRKKIEVNALGREQNVLAEEAPLPGKNLYLTIDADAQRKLEGLINDYAKKTGKKRIAAVALDPRDGGVMALVSWPSFNDNDFSGGIDQTKYQAYLDDADRPLFNRAIAGAYPSGSTVKPVIAAAALQENIITKTTTVLSTGGIVVGDRIFRDWLAGGHGVTNVTKALAWSVNTFFYYVGGGYKNFVGLGLDKLTKYFKEFNLYKKTGIDLPGEVAGFIPTKEWKESTKGERWYIGDTYNLSIGQGDLLVTPLQVAVWTEAMANGGQVISPHVVDKIVDPITKESSVYTPNISTTSVSAANLEIVRGGMRECVVSGSCGLLRTLPFASAGKTGTAQWSSKNPTHAWFTAFAPYNNPQMTISVLVEEGGEGSRAAMPIARDFLAWWGKKYLGN